jgi:RecA-family ATPase
MKALNEVKFTRLSEVHPRPVDWLWPGRLAAGKLHVLDGDPGAGKSTLMVDLMARFSTGSPMPDGHKLEGPRSSVLLSAEDAADDTIRPRLDAAGADPSRIVLFDGLWMPRDEREPEADDHVLAQPSLPAHLVELEALIRGESAALVVVDVLNAFLSSKVDGHKDQDIRTALSPIAKVAENTGSCIVVLRHLNKGGGSNPLYRGGGSIGIIGAARVGLLAAGDPDDETRRVLAVTKSNLAAVSPALAYRLVDAPEHGCARIQWEGATDHSAADLLSIGSADHEDQADAAVVLAGILAEGPRWVKDCIDEGASAGFSKDQMKRAKAKLRVRSEKVGGPGDPESGWKWTLPREHEESEGSSTPDPAPFAPLVHPSAATEAVA